MNRFILSALALALVFSVSAQTFELKDHDGNVVSNDDSFDMWAPEGTIEMDFGLDAENITSSSITVGVKRYEVDVTTGSKNYFCWNVCYSPTLAGEMPYWIAQDPLIMDDVDSVYTNFHAYHRPTGTTGISTYRYVFYNQADQNDSISITITFNSSPTSVAELENKKEGITAYPSPAVGNTTLSYKLNQNGNAKIMLHNMLGAKVKEYTLDNIEGKLKLSVVDLKPGVYFYSLVQNDRTIEVKRLVVAGR